MTTLKLKKLGMPVEKLFGVEAKEFLHRMIDAANPDELIVSGFVFEENQGTVEMRPMEEEGVICFTGPMTVKIARDDQ